MTTAGTTLPRAAEATVPRDKLESYCLNPEHQTGRHKARVFLAAPGIGVEDWEYLSAQLREGIQRSPVVSINPGAWGTRYEVTVAVDGLNGKNHPVTSVWFAEDDEPPHLISAYVRVP